MTPLIPSGVLRSSSSSNYESEDESDQVDRGGSRKRDRTDGHSSSSGDRHCSPRSTTDIAISTLSSSSSSSASTSGSSLSSDSTILWLSDGKIVSSAFERILDPGYAELDGEVKGATPLHFAVYHDRFEEVVRLLEEGADPNATIEDDRRPHPRTGWTPLHFAINADTKSKYEIMRKLVQHPLTNVNAIAIGQGPPLLLAVSKADVEAVKILLEAQAVVFPTILRAGVYCLRSDILELLLVSRGQHPIPEEERRIDALLQDGAGLDYCHGYNEPQNGESLLHLAVRLNLYDSARCLVNMGGANVNACDQNNQTPLHLAAKGGMYNILGFLIQNGGDPHRRCSPSVGGQSVVELVPEEERTRFSFSTGSSCTIT